MIRSVSFSEFRGFDEVEIGPFAQVNLILGRNNAGKSTVLEGLFLLSGPTNPQLPMTLSGLRGVEAIRNDPEELWGWLFYKKKTGRSISVSSEGTNGKSRTLTLRMVESKGHRTSQKKSGRRPVRTITTATSADTPSQLQLRFRDENGQVYTTSATMKETGLEYARERTLQVPMTIFVTGRSGYASENAERYSKLEEVGKESDLLPALRHLEPRLKRLAVLVTAAGPVIHGDIGLGHMIPMQFMGEGIGRLMTILLAITSSPKGMALIDEIEMGLHYSAMVAAWKAVAELARAHEVQVVATTHNWECLRAAHQVFDTESAASFAVHRLDRQDDRIKSTSLTADMIEMAMRSGLELR